ncbi:MAG TPA: hypothetical protein VIM11_12650 [Tepidisphaeraceae bacterium]|jgi:hypothetical protein
MAHTLVVFSSDESYFPLARGLVLSLKQCDLDVQGIGIGFLDNGCAESSLEWMRAQGVVVRRLDPASLGNLAGVAGYHRSQICRPFLPRLFPDVEAFVWLDTDLWVQDPAIVGQLSGWARSAPQKLFIAPEWHYSYLKLNMDFDRFQLSTFGFYYRATYGADATPAMVSRPMLNTGVFAMAAANPLWHTWQHEVETLYSREYPDRPELVRHMAKQIALNKLAYQAGCVIPIDPIYNYMCTWAPPYRDTAGVVRVTLPPYSVLGIVHLSNWRHYRKLYGQLGLLFDQGRYLTPAERAELIPQ